jgi:transcriptional regulator with XRE-family HTH domain
MIGDDVRRRREDLGLTGAQLAARAGMAPSAISQIETGKRMPSFTSVIKLADALGVSVGELFPKDQNALPLDYFVADAPLEEEVFLSPDEAIEFLKSGEAKSRSYQIDITDDGVFVRPIRGNSEPRRVRTGHLRPRERT